MTSKEYNDRFQDLFTKLRAISYSDHAWEMDDEEILKVTPFTITNHGVMMTVTELYYDRGNEDIRVCVEEDDLFWNSMSQDAREEILKRETAFMYKEELLEQVKDDVKRELGFIGDYAGEIAENIAEEVLEDIQECADKDYNDSDVRLAIGRVLARVTSIGK